MSMSLALGLGLPFGGGGSSATPILTSNKLALFIGDSTFVGVGAGSGGGSNVNGSRPFSTPTKASVRLNALGISATNESVVSDNNVGLSGAGNPNWPAYRSDIAITGTVGLASRTPTTGGNQVGNDPAGNFFTWTPTTNIDTFAYLLPRFAALNSIGVSIDGGTATSVNVAHTPDDMLLATSSVVLGSHNIAFKAATGSAYRPSALWAYNSASPTVLVLNGGARNFRSSDWAATATPAPSVPVNTNANGPINAIGYLAPDIVVISLGINDAVNTGGTPTSFKANMQALINKAIAANAAVKIILVNPHYVAASSTIAGFANSDMRQAYVDLKASNPSAILVDSPALLAPLAGGQNPATWETLNANGYMFDNLHPNAGVAGDGGVYQVIGYAIGDAIKLALGL